MATLYLLRRASTGRRRERDEDKEKKDVGGRFSRSQSLVTKAKAKQVTRPNTFLHLLHSKDIQVNRLERKRRKSRARQKGALSRQRLARTK